MKKGYLYYLVTGDPLLSKIKAFQAESEKLNAEMKAFLARFGAVGSFGSNSGVEALDFDHGKHPEGWVQFRKRGNLFHRPTAKMEGGALLKEMRALRHVNHYTLQKHLTGSSSSFDYMGQDCCGYCICMEYIGETPMLMIPVPACGFAQKGAQLVMPDTGVVLLTEADYYQLKADAAKKKSPA